MAQSRRVTPNSHKRPRPPLDEEALERIALFYVGRYASTRAKLRTYLVRKVRARGWHDGGEPPVDSLFERISRMGYIDDAAFAQSPAESLSRRRYCPRPVDKPLPDVGISAPCVAPTNAPPRPDATSQTLRV